MATKEKAEEDWRSGKSLAECNLHVLEEQKYYDVTFNFTNSKSAVPIKALKLMLMKRSTVFDKMFNGEMAETKDQIDITDIEPDAFYEMMRFIYADQVNLTGDNAMSVMYAAKKYMITGLVSRCEEFLKTNLSPDNAAILLQQSIFFEAQELQKRCMETIQKETAKVFESEAFINANRQAVTRILESTSFNVPEIKVFEACVAWAKSRCQDEGNAGTGSNVRAALGDMIYQIRFPTMKQEEYAQKVVSVDLLDDKETAMLFKHFCCNEKPANMPFSDQARQSIEESHPPRIRPINVQNVRSCGHCKETLTHYDPAVYKAYCKLCRKHTKL